MLNPSSAFKEPKISFQLYSWREITILAIFRSSRFLVFMYLGPSYFGPLIQPSKQNGH